MILSDKGISLALDNGEIDIDPRPTAEQYTTSAVDLFIGADFRCWDPAKLNVKGFTPTLNLAEQEFQLTAAAHMMRMQLDNNGFFVFPPFAKTQSHVLGITRERVHLKLGARVAARVEGRSSLARIGLVVHLTAPTIHAGFNGHITLEMINYSPYTLTIEPNKTRICQLIFERLETEPGGDIRTDFQGQIAPSGEQKG